MNIFRKILFAFSVVLLSIVTYGQDRKIHAVRYTLADTVLVSNKLDVPRRYTFVAVDTVTVELCLWPSEAVYYIEEMGRRIYLLPTDEVVVPRAWRRYYDLERYISDGTFVALPLDMLPVTHKDKENDTYYYFIDHE